MPEENKTPLQVKPAENASVDAAKNVPTSVPSENDAKPEPPKSAGTFSLSGVSGEQPKMSLLSKLMKLDDKKAPNGSDQGNVFTNLFGTAKSAVQKPASGPAPSLAQMLGPKPVFSKAAFEESQRRKKKIARSFFYAALVIALGCYGFFYSQLNPNFNLLSSYLGANTASQFERNNAELQKTQTDLNLINLRIARLWLDELNTLIDPYLSALAVALSEYSAPADKKIAQEKIAGANPEIKKNLIEVQKIFSMQLGVDIFSREPVTIEQREQNYENLLKETLGKQKAALSSEARPNLDEIRIIDNVLRLAENKGFRAMLRSRDFGKISDAELGVVLKKIRTEGTDELASIEKIKSSRLSWGQVIRDIHSVVRKADLYYGQGLFKTVGGFVFSSYRFDAKTGRISISGITKTSDSKTFSFIAKLIDSIERSPQFKDIDFRSFSKTRDESGDFSSGLNLDFSIQKDTDSRDDLLESSS